MKQRNTSCLVTCYCIPSLRMWHLNSERIAGSIPHELKLFGVDITLLSHILFHQLEMT